MKMTTVDVKDLLADPPAARIWILFVCSTCSTLQCCCTAPLQFCCIETFMNLSALNCVRTTISQEHNRQHVRATYAFFFKQ